MRSLLIRIYNDFPEDALGPNAVILGKDFLYQGSLMSVLSFLRREQYDTVAAGIYSMDFQVQFFAIKMVVWLSRAKHKVVIDTKQQQQRVTVGRLLLDGIRLLVEIPMSLMVWARSWLAVLHLRDMRGRTTDAKEIINVLFCRTDLLFGIKAGGSLGHIEGVLDGFLQLGYKTRFMTTEDILGRSNDHPTTVIPPQTLFQNIPEIPNLSYSFHFAREVGKRIGATPEPFMIYQRYSVLNFSGLLLKQRCHAPLVLEYNGSEVWVAKHWGKKMLFSNLATAIENLNLRLADLIVVVSNVLKDELVERGIPEKKIAVYPNCVSPEKFSPKLAEHSTEVRKKYGLEKKFLVGFIGTFGAWHGVEVLAASVRRVLEKARRPDVHFLIIGDGLLKQRMLEILRSDGVLDRVTLTGLIPQSDAPRYLAACDILVSPHVPNPDGSKFFGSPTKLFEYMASGKPIVASDLDQIGDVLEDHRTALLSRPGDVEDFSAKLATLIDDPELQHRLGRNARQEVLERYTWKRHVEEIVSSLLATL